MKKRSVLALILALLLLTPSILSCSETTVESDTSAQTSADTTPDVEVVPEEPDIYENLPTGDFGGADFNLLQYEEVAAATTTICVEEMNGETINDAIFMRTETVNERLNTNVLLTTESLEQVNNIMSTSIVAGDDVYQAFWQHSTTAVTNFLAKDYLIDLDQFPAFDFTKPWWNANAMDSLRLTDKTFMAFGDINYYLFDFQSIIICNMPLVTNFNMENPYTLVNEGRWTIDTFLGMVESGAMDLNGNGMLGDADDLLGFTGHTTATELGFTHAAGAELFSRDSSNRVVYDGVSEKYFDILSRYSAVLGKKEYAEHSGECVIRFQNERSLLTSCSVGQLSTMRDTEFDYAVLPFPKYDEAQENYISFITNQMQPMVIPKTVQDINRAGVVLENLSAESHRMVRDKYFEELLEYKYVRDQESIAILNMLYSSDACFELPHIYGWHGLEGDITNALTGKADTFMSIMKKKERLLIKAMDKTLEYLS